MSKIEERELRKSYIKHQIRQLLRKLIEVKKQKPQKSKSSSIGSFFYKHVIPGGMIDHNQQQKQIQQNNLTLEIKLSKFMGIVNRYYSQLQSKLTNLQRLLEFRNKQVLGLNNRLEEENKGRLEDVLALKTKVESLEETIDKFQQQKRYSVSFDEVYDRMNDLTCYNPKTLLKNQKVYFIDQNKLNEIHSMEKLLQGFKKYQYNVCSIVQHKDLDQQLKQLKTKQQSGRQLFEASSVLQQGQINCFKSKLSTINDGLCKQKSMHSSNQQQLLVIEQQI